MHDLPLSPEDRSTLLRVVRSQPPRDRLLAELVFGHGLGLPDALSVKADEIAWGEDRVKLCAHTGRSARRTVTVERDVVEGVLGERRHGPVFATHSGVPIRPDYAVRLLGRVAEGAGVPSGVSVKRVRSRRPGGARRAARPNAGPNPERRRPAARAGPPPSPGSLAQRPAGLEQ